MTFRGSDEFMALLGDADRGALQRARLAVSNGTTVIQTPFVTVITSSTSTRPMLAMSSDKRIGCVVDGHLFGAHAAEDPISFWKSARSCTRGSYNLLFWNEHVHHARVRTDQLGFRSLYYWTAPAGKVLILASSLSLLRKIVSGLRPDPTAFREQLLVSAVLGDGTLLHGVKRLRPHVELRLEANGTSNSRIARTEVWGDLYAKQSVREAAELTVGVAEDVVRDWVAGAAVRVALSGGYDSRLLLLLAQRARVPIRAVTLGDRTWVDQRLASRVARQLGVPYRAVPPPSAVTLKEYIQALELGEHVADYMSGFWLVHFARRVASTAIPILNGFLGGPVSGAAIAWVRGRAQTRDDIVKGWLRHVNEANVPFRLLRRLSPDNYTDAREANEETMRQRLTKYCPSDVPLYQAATALEVAVRQFGFVSVGTYGLYRRFSRPLTPLADYRIIRLFGNMGRFQLQGQITYRTAVALIDRSRVPVASTSGPRPATFGAGPQKVIEIGFSNLAPAFSAVIREHSRELAELLDAERLLRHIDAATKTPRADVGVPQCLMLVNAALLWLLYSNALDNSASDEWSVQTRRQPAESRLKGRETASRGGRPRGQ